MSISIELKPEVEERLEHKALAVLRQIYQGAKAQRVNSVKRRDGSGFRQTSPV